MQFEVLANAGAPAVVRNRPDAADFLPVIHFYYPPGAADTVVPESVGVFKYRPGDYVWTVKTYGFLSRSGFPCRLTDQLPDEGIVVAHRKFFARGMVPNRRQLFVCVVADYWRHPFAQLHLVQNPRDPLLIRGARAWPAAFMPHWPETGLIRRDPARGEAFENVAYFGLPERLAPQLRSAEFAARLRAHGFRFRIVGRDAWNDYGDTDAVLAVRSYAASSFHKYPPTKLYNSWLAGVPALLGRESAYRAARRNEYDYFEVRSTDEIIRTLIRLRDHPDLRAAVSRNCAQRAAEVNPERITESWVAFLTMAAVPAYQDWRRRSFARRGVFLVARSGRYAGWVCVDFLTRAVNRIRRLARDLER
jgi:hypothetical protein